ncbi:PilW family protein [Pseudomonas parafulva]|uniref:PilW family protein n=1 Tax=Pseudomonas parafulva TaxID=157782 RepID=UPI00042551C1|nr:prepilin-type N-terminal cleavage/methylation domain-containing protein [Pseudomonas parafulva]
MRRVERGYGLLELLLALAIGLMLLTTASQLFASAHQVWRLQGAALRMQEDARLALLRMAQDIRMAGMFGCLRLLPGDFPDSATRLAFTRPVEVGPSSLNLIVADVAGHVLHPDWTVLTNCRDHAQVAVGQVQGSGELAIPISRHRYELRGSTLYFTRSNSTQPLMEHVRSLDIAYLTSAGSPRIDLDLALHDPALQLQQRHRLSVALRNPVLP